jgi:hypothetical protein
MSNPCTPAPTADRCPRCRAWFNGRRNGRERVGIPRADTVNHDQYAGFDGFAEPAVSPDVPPMSLKGRAGLSADEAHAASAAPIERIREVEN